MDSIDASAIVDVKFSIIPIIRMECQTEEAPLITTPSGNKYLVPNVQKWSL